MSNNKFSLINTESLDMYVDSLIEYKNIELDLRQLCGKFVMFYLSEYEITANHNSMSVNQIVDYFQSKMNLKHKEDRGYYRSVIKV